MKIELHQGSLKLVLYKENTGCISIEKLTRSEFYILQELLNRPGHHIPKSQLINAGWPDSFVCDNALNMVIMSLRKKLGKLNWNNGEELEINTIYKVGYSATCSSLQSTLDYTVITM